MNFSVAMAGTAHASAPAPPSAAAALEHRKLTEAAQQFEGMLLQEMLKPMKEHGFSQEDDDKEGDDDGKQEGGGLGDTLSSFGTETMATAIAKGGGLGIARRVVEQVEGEKAAHQIQNQNQFQNREAGGPKPGGFQNKKATVLKSSQIAPII
jgi:flagellar protein FlgJ